MGYGFENAQATSTSHNNDYRHPKSDSLILMMLMCCFVAYFHWAHLLICFDMFFFTVSFHLPFSCFFCFVIFCTSSHFLLFETLRSKHFVPATESNQTLPALGLSFLLLLAWEGLRTVLSREWNRVKRKQTNGRSLFATATGQRQVCQRRLSAKDSLCRVRTVGGLKLD